MPLVGYMAERPSKVMKRRCETRTFSPQDIIPWRHNPLKTKSPQDIIPSYEELKCKNRYFSIQFNSISIGYSGQHSPPPRTSAIVFISWLLSEHNVCIYCLHEVCWSQSVKRSSPGRKCHDSWSSWWPASQDGTQSACDAKLNKLCSDRS